MRRIIPIFLIFVATSTAWIYLSATVSQRTFTQSIKLQRNVGQLWGGPIVQPAPTTHYVAADASSWGMPQAGSIDASDIAVNIALEHRRKGLLWYPTYLSSFSGTYTIAQPAGARQYAFVMPLPKTDAVFENFSVRVDGKPLDSFRMKDGLVECALPPKPGATKIQVSYNVQGMGEWWYSFGQNVESVRNFNLVMDCNFADIDFPDAGIAPKVKTRTKDGWRLAWNYGSLFTSVRIGLVMPRKLNPGPWVEQVTRAAPISLFLFFFILFIITTLRRIDIHPMNYFFIAAAFFSFHLLLAYTADHLSIHVAFLLSAAVSIALVISYMRLVANLRFALVEVGVTQFVYLVLFSYTFFFEGLTGLAITVLGIITLFIVMQLTGRLDWAQALNPDGGETPHGGPSRKGPSPKSPDATPSSETTPACGAGSWQDEARTSPPDDDILSLD